MESELVIHILQTETSFQTLTLGYLAAEQTHSMLVSVLDLWSVVRVTASLHRSLSPDIPGGDGSH